MIFLLFEKKDPPTEMLVESKRDQETQDKIWDFEILILTLLTLNYIGLFGFLSTDHLS